MLACFLVLWLIWKLCRYLFNLELFKTVKLGISINSCKHILNSCVAVWINMSIFWPHLAIRSILKNIRSIIWAASWQTNKVSVCPAKTQISLGIRPVWSESSLSAWSAWRKLGPLATYWAHSEFSDQTWRMPRLIWIFAGRTATLLVLSRGGSFSVTMTRFGDFQARFVKMIWCRILSTFQLNILHWKV